MPKTKATILEFLEIYRIHPRLKPAISLILKSELDSAVREAFVVLETVISEKTGITNSHGRDLVAKAFSFEIDNATGEIKKAPLIAINELKTESDRNEHEGIKLMLIGFFQGPRNIFHHKQIPASMDMKITIVLQTSFFLWLIDGHSLLQKGRWIPKKLDNKMILAKMPRLSDRLRFKSMIRRRARMIQKKEKENTQ